MAHEPFEYRKAIASCSAFAVLCLASTASFAQTGSVLENSLPAQTAATSSVERPKLLEFFTGTTPYEFWLIVIVALLGLGIIVALLKVVSTASGFKAEDAYRPTILLAIVVAAIIIVIGGFSTEQIGPAFALFGTIVGYMLRRAEDNVATYRDNVAPDSGQSGRRAPSTAPEEKPASAAGQPGGD